MRHIPVQYQSTGKHSETTAYHVAVLETNLQGQHQQNIVIEPTTGAPLEYRHLIKGPTKPIWENLFANEIGRLSKRFVTMMPSVTNTIFFIPKGKFPVGKTVTYGELWPQYEHKRLKHIAPDSMLEEI